MGRDLSRLLAPKSVAVVGGREAEAVLQRCDALGYEGELWPVNPNRPTLAGRSCVATVDDLPGTPDAAFIAVDRNATIEVVRRLAAHDCGGAVCYASGYAELGAEGAALQEDLVAAAGTMAVLGPNCHGLVNAADRMALWPDIHGCSPVDSGVAIVSQSGNVAISMSLQQRSLPLSHVVSIGNQAMIGAEDVAGALLDDPRVTAIGFYLESVRDPGRFGEVATRAAAQQVPFVALRTGSSPAGAAIARTHTGALAGRPEAYRALFDRYGVATVRTIPELLETLKLLHYVGPLSGHRVVSISCSGGEASHIADLARSADLDFPAFDPGQAGRMRGALGADLAVSNPLDYHTYAWGDREALTAGFTAALEQRPDLGLLLLDAPAPASGDDGWRIAAVAMVDAGTATGTRVGVAATMPENLPEELRSFLAAAGVAPLQGLAEALAAMNAAAWLGERSGVAPVPHSPAGAPVGELWLDEAASKDVLEGWGVPVPRRAVIAAGDGPEAAVALGFPVAAKLLGVDHKTEVGGVHTDLRSADDLGAALAAWPAGARVLVEEMVPGVAELLVSIRREAPLGWRVTLAAGGSLAEIVADAAHLLAPVEPGSVRAALRALRSYPLLTGFRGHRPVDLDAVAQTIARLAAAAVAANVVEVEVNPFVVGPAGGCAVDALVTLEGADG